MKDEDIRDLFAGLGPITIRRMFGGKGIYHEGVIFALEVDGEILLKADRESAPDFAEAGSRQWVYTGKPGRKPTAMPYWSIPDSALDDTEEMSAWARKAYEAGLRTRK
ncbi:TfoX/Sxy family protein [Chelativorans sp. M5D2P16]|uniref:TfoX/Sxy family protein n=1 Tax=Chelativorans sp. M5D2P16 TaxID=3095678 RepID=UPI002ACAEC86|nr:TfoX/Sxy family protein [Chelativorans sp. M5D2P16]MDZ5697053.1 TfoX/Sxy family protein [Chelativorans sp. M5D2P16]